MTTRWSVVAACAAMAMGTRGARADWAVLPAPTVQDYVGGTGGGVGGCDDLQFQDVNLGMFVAVNGDPADITKLITVFLKTTTGGTSWTGAKIAAFGSHQARDRARLSFASASNGWVVSNQKVAFTSDGGTSWMLATLPAGAIAVDVAALGPTTAVVTAMNGILRTTDGTTFTSVSTSASDLVLSFDTMTGVATGGLRTTNGGMTWTQSGASAPMLGVTDWSRASATTAYAIGSVNKWSKTTDAGQTWSTPVVLSDCSVMGVAFVDDSHGVIGCKGLGQGSPTETRYSLYTSNGGTSWVHEPWPANWPARGIGSGINGVRCMAFPTATVAYAGWDYYEKQLIKRTGPSTPVVDGGPGAPDAALVGDGGSSAVDAGPGGGGGGGGGCDLGGGRSATPATTGALLLLLVVLVALRSRAARSARE